MRIVGGEARGRTIHAPQGQTTRPTSDRVRQSLFDVLGQRCDGLAVLDLYAGTGALALEAISRGAVSAVLVEKDRAAVAAIERTLAGLKWEYRCSILKLDVAVAVGKLAGQTFDLVFSDPPYALRAAQATLDRLHRHALVAPGGRVVIERDRREERPGLPAGFGLADEREFGDTVVLIARRAG